MLNSELENKQQMIQEAVQKNKQERKGETEPKEKKKIETSVIFLWASYALTMIFIILVVCDNLQP